MSHGWVQGVSNPYDHVGLFLYMTFIAILFLNFTPKTWVEDRLHLDIFWPKKMSSVRGWVDWLVCDLVSVSLNLGAEKSYGIKFLMGCFPYWFVGPAKACCVSQCWCGFQWFKYLPILSWSVHFITGTHEGLSCVFFFFFFFPSTFFILRKSVSIMSLVSITH